MPGFEIIGLVLGALPLVISTLEHYNDGLDPVKDYLRYSRTLKSLRTRLRIQQELFEGTLQRLLRDQLSDVQAQILFPDIGRPGDESLWGSSKIDDMLHRRLGDRYSSFMDVIEEMEQVMRQLMDKLEVDIETKPKWTADPLLSHLQGLKRSTRGQWEWRKIRRSFGRKEREALIQGFERYNENIASYVAQREILAPSIRSRSDVFSKYYHVVRDSACGLYEALEDGWKCSCHCPHYANLQLERRNAAETLPSFKMSLSFLDHSSQPSQKAWLEAQIDIHNLDEEQINTTCKSYSHTSIEEANPTLVTVVAPNSSFIARSVVMPFMQDRSRSKVRIIEADEGSKPQLKTHAAQNKTPTGNSQRLSHIPSLCQAIQQAKNVPTCLGFLANVPRKRSIHFTTTISLPDPVEHVPLESLLPPRNAEERPSRKYGKLTRQQRLRIAVTLASAVLQLHKSPWLSETWSKKDIYFFSRGVDEYNRPLIDRAYVSRSFSTSANTRIEAATASTANDFLKCQIINKSLFALGITLIELCLNRPFEDLCAEEKCPVESEAGEPNIADIYRVATSQIEAVYDEAGTEYGYVVQRCLKCEFGVQDSKKQLDFETFRGLVYEGVVEPLEEDFRRFNPGV